MARARRPDSIAPGRHLPFKTMHDASFFNRITQRSYWLSAVVLVFVPISLILLGGAFCRGPAVLSPGTAAPGRRFRGRPGQSPGTGTLPVPFACGGRPAAGRGSVARPEKAGCPGRPGLRGPLVAGGHPVFPHLPHAHRSLRSAPGFLPVAGQLPFGGLFGVLVPVEFPFGQPGAVQPERSDQPEHSFLRHPGRRLRRVPPGGLRRHDPVRVGIPG